MLDFTKIGGQIHFPLIGDSQSAVEKLLNQYEWQLGFEGAKDITRHGDILEFSGARLRFRWNGRFLQIIDKGFIRVFLYERKLVVMYRLAFLRYFLMTLFIAILAASLVFSAASDVIASLKVLFVMWSFTLGTLVVYALLSFLIFVRGVWSAVFQESLFWKILYILAS